MSAFKTDEEIESLLNHPKNGLKKINVQVKIIGSGNHGKQSEDSKKSGEQHRDLESKANVAVLAEFIGNKNAGLLMGMGPTQVSQYKNGKNASNVVKTDLVHAIDERLEKISKKTVNRVNTLLNIFVEDKMNELKPNEIPQAAKSLIEIFEKVNKSSDKNAGLVNKPSVVIYAP